MTKKIFFLKYILGGVFVIVFGLWFKPVFATTIYCGDGSFSCSGGIGPGNTQACTATYPTACTGDNPTCVAFLPLQGGERQSCDGWLTECTSSYVETCNPGNVSAACPANPNGTNVNTCATGSASNLAWNGCGLTWKCTQGASTVNCSGNPGYTWTANTWNTSTCSTTCQQSRSYWCKDNVYSHDGGGSCCSPTTHANDTGNCSAGTVCNDSNACTTNDVCNGSGSCVGTNNPVNGSCGTSNGSSFYSAPSTNLCSAGTATAVAGSGPWTWSCNGSCSGANPACSASKKVDGSCGTSNGSSFSSAPSTNLCAVGTASAVSGTGPWSWTCSGTNGGITASCSASKSGILVNGSCGTANNSNFYSAPSSNLCSAGTATAVSGSGPWSWNCNGANGGSNTSCSANKSVDGSCGSSNNSSFSSAPSTNLCSVGSASTVTGTGPWSWTCSGSNGGTTASCSASKTGTPVNGACGSANGSSYSSAPSTNLCSAGTATAVSGSGPWTWSCNGSGGGTNASCSANVTVVAQNGQCGPAATTYADTATNFTGAFCNVGSANPASPAFPAQGGSTTWTCSGVNGGSSSGTCTASRNVPSGACVPPTITYTLHNSNLMDLSWNYDGATWYYNPRINDNTTNNATIWDDPRFAGRCGPHYYCENGVYASSYCSGNTCTITNIPITLGDSYTLWIDPNYSPARNYCNGAISFVPSNPPIGVADVTNCNSFGGWTFDPDTSSQSINYQVYKDGPVGVGALIGTYPTNVLRPDVNAAYGITGNHGYNITTPSQFIDGAAHSAYIYAVDSYTGATALLSNSPTTITCVPPAPAPDLKVTGWASWAGNGRDTPFLYDHSDGPAALYAYQPYALSWNAVANASSCTLDGPAVSTAATTINTYSLPQANTPSNPKIHTLSCTGPGGAGSNSVNLSVPPPPTNPSGNCNAAGTASTFSWTKAAGYALNYVRVCELTGGPGTPCATNLQSSITSNGGSEAYTASSASVATTPGKTYYWWVHTRDSGSGAWSDIVDGTFICAVCPAAGNSVSLSSGSVTAGNTVTASAPSDFSGGSFSSSNNGIATVSGSTVTGVSAGSASITGSGWSYINGATNCSLAGAALTVNQATANLNTSEKDITKVNGTLVLASPNGVINGHTDPLPAAVAKSLKAGDVVTFAIIINNTGNGGATNLVIRDTLVNMVIPDSGWNAKFNGIAIPDPSLSGSTYNQTLTFTLPAGNNSVPANSVRVLTFNAQLAVDPGYAGNSPVFQNSFNADFNNGITSTTAGPFSTPPLFFSLTGGTPIIIEVP